MDTEYDAGMGTTPGMWEMVSELLDGEQIPESVSDAINALAHGRATVTIKQGAEQ